MLSCLGLSCSGAGWAFSRPAAAAGARRIAGSRSSAAVLTTQRVIRVAVLLLRQLQPEGPSRGELCRSGPALCNAKPSVRGILFWRAIGIKRRTDLCGLRSWKLEKFCAVSGWCCKKKTKRETFVQHVSKCSNARHCVPQLCRLLYESR